MIEATHAMSEKRATQIVWTMLCLMPIIGMCIDLVAPSLPAIAAGLHVPNHMAKNAISIYLMGFALGNFFTGFLTDALGRQKLMRLSLLAFTLVSVIPIFFPTIGLLLIARFLQGYTIGAVSVLLRAVCSDVLSPEKLTRLGPWFGTMWGLGPVLGPIMGGYLQTYFGWQAGFYFFALIGLIGLIAVLFILPETHTNKHPLNIQTIRKNSLEILSRPLFLGIVTLMGLTYSLLIVFNISGPFLIQTTLHYSPLFFGRIALYLGLVFLVSTLFSRFLLKITSVEKLWLIFINACFSLGVVLLVASYFFAHAIMMIEFASAFMFFTCGMIFPMSLGKGLSLFRHMAGTATAVMYLVNISITSIVSYFIGFIAVDSLMHLMWINMGLLFLVVVLYWGVLRQSR